MYFFVQIPCRSFLQREQIRQDCFIRLPWSRFNLFLCRFFVLAGFFVILPFFFVISNNFRHKFKFAANIQNTFGQNFSSSSFILVLHSRNTYLTFSQTGPRRPCIRVWYRSFYRYFSSSTIDVWVSWGIYILLHLMAPVRLYENSFG